VSATPMVILYYYAWWGPGGYYGTCCWDPARGYGYGGYASANVYGRWSNCQRFHEGRLGQPAYRELWCRQSHYISNISPFTTSRVLSNWCTQELSPRDAATFFSTLPNR